MKFNLSKEKPELKLKVLIALIPAFPVKTISIMTGLPRNNIAYYRSKGKPDTHLNIKKRLNSEAQQNIRDQLEHNEEYALSVVEDLLHEHGIPYE